jgi:predicted metal-dependent phosphotriesterase family hydrolase
VPRLRRRRLAKREGISDADIDVMVRKNPAKLLGLTNETEE